MFVGEKRPIPPKVALGVLLRALADGERLWRDRTLATTLGTFLIGERIKDYEGILAGKPQHRKYRLTMLLDALRPGRSARQLQGR